MVLTMVAVLSLIVIAASDAAMMGIRRTQNQTEQAQARWYLAGAETFAASRLRELLDRGPDAGVDQADWQGRPWSFPLDDGAMTLTLYDASNCFNLNSVVTRDEGGLAFPDFTAQVQLARLIENSGASPALGAMSLSAALADWIDPDSSPNPGGAEDESYGSEDRPYRAANVALASLADLARVRGFSPSVVRAIKPFVCVRSPGVSTQLNPNTLAPEQAVLMSAVVGAALPRAAAETVLRARPRGGWANLDAFFAEPAILAANLPDAVRAQFTLSPRYFAMNADVTHKGARETVLSLLDMAQGGQVVRRVYGAPKTERVL